MDSSSTKRVKPENSKQNTTIQYLLWWIFPVCPPHIHSPPSYTLLGKLTFMDSVSRLFWSLASIGAWPTGNPPKVRGKKESWVRIIIPQASPRWAMGWPCPSAKATASSGWSLLYCGCFLTFPRCQLKHKFSGLRMVSLSPAHTLTNSPFINSSITSCYLFAFLVSRGNSDQNNLWLIFTKKNIYIQGLKTQYSF